MSGFDRPFRMHMLVWMHPRGVAPERVSKADATDGSVRDRQSPSISVGGLFHFAITAVSSRAEVLDVNARFAGLGLPGAPNV